MVPTYFPANLNLLRFTFVYITNNWCYPTPPNWPTMPFNSLIIFIVIRLRIRELGLYASLVTVKSTATIKSFSDITVLSSEGRGLFIQLMTMCAMACNGAQILRFNYFRLKNNHNYNYLIIIIRLNCFLISVIILIFKF